jgi:hypothetical protein
MKDTKKNSRSGFKASDCECCFSSIDIGAQKSSPLGVEAIPQGFLIGAQKSPLSFALLWSSVAQNSPTYFCATDQIVAVEHGAFIRIAPKEIV